MQKKNRIVQILRIIMLVAAIISVIIFPPWKEILAWITPLPDTVQEQVDNAIDLGFDGIIVYVDEPGKTPAFYSAGISNKAPLTPADPHSLFKIASISKLYIATAAAKLASAGSLSLDDTLADYLPELAGRIEYADQITLRMMLQHRSGIPNFTDVEGWDWFIPHTDIESVLELVLDSPAVFTPNSKYRYSNTNYLLIGRILDQVLGYSHQEYIENEILTPLGLTNTYGLPDQAEYDDIVSGYWIEYNDDLRQLEFVIPGGSMVASAQDVGIFLRALNDGSLLSDEEQAIYSSIYDYEHTGWLPGYYSIARYYQDIDTVIIQFVNTTGGNTIMLSDIIYGRIVKILNR